jgi:hypothetical protein
MLFWANKFAQDPTFKIIIIINYFFKEIYIIKILIFRNKF